MIFSRSEPTKAELIEIENQFKELTYSDSIDFLEENKKYLQNYNFFKMMMDKTDGCMQFDMFSKKIKNDFECVKIAVSKRPYNLLHASKKMQDNMDIVKIAVEQDFYTIKFASERLQKHPELLLYLLENITDLFNLKEFLNLIPKISLKENRIVIEHILNKDPTALEFLSNKVKNDFDLVFKAVSHRGVALKYASKEMSGNYAIVKTAIRHHGECLKYATKSLQNNGDLIKIAVGQSNPEYLKELLNTEWDSHADIYLEAAKHNGYITLQYASHKTRHNIDLAKIAIENDEKSWELLPEGVTFEPVRYHPEVLISLFHKNPMVFYYKLVDYPKRDYPDLLNQLDKIFYTKPQIFFIESLKNLEVDLEHNDEIWETLQMNYLERFLFEKFNLESLKTCSKKLEFPRTIKKINYETSKKEILNLDIKKDNIIKKNRKTVF